jgi:hypothetical protein
MSEHFSSAPTDSKAGSKLADTRGNAIANAPQMRTLDAARTIHASPSCTARAPGPATRAKEATPTTASRRSPFQGRTSLIGSGVPRQKETADENAARMGARVASWMPGSSRRCVDRASCAVNSTATQPIPRVGTCACAGMACTPCRMSNLALRDRKDGHEAFVRESMRTNRTSATTTGNRGASVRSIDQ